MSEFDAIRPYHDHEVPGVIARILANPEFARAAARMALPRWLADTAAGRWWTRSTFARKTRGVHTVWQCQLIIETYFRQLLDHTTDGVSVSGVERLSQDGRYLFVSNHRDIAMDSILLNYLLHQHGHSTCRMAVGDNLLANDLAADLMRLNKSFVVERDVTGVRNVHRVLSRTSRYIRHSLEEGVSVWIAQREGRAKDGWDRTDPALLKMLTLAYREAANPLQALVDASHIVPVSVSYELDPCARAKARELHAVATEGSYAKAAEEDVQSIIQGLTGAKGRMHLHFGEVVSGTFGEPAELASAIDQAIVGGLQVFPTHVAAARALGDADPAGVEQLVASPVLPEVMRRYDEALEATAGAERPYYLLQYANVLRSRAALGLTVTDTPGAARRAAPAAPAGPGDAPTSSGAGQTPETPEETPDPPSAARSRPHGA